MSACTQVTGSAEDTSHLPHKGNTIAMLQYMSAADVKPSDDVKGCGHSVLTAPERPPSFAHSSRLDTRGMSFSLSRVLELHAKSPNQTPTPIQG